MTTTNPNDHDRHLIDGRYLEEGAALMDIAGATKSDTGPIPPIHSRLSDDPGRGSYDVIVIGAGQAGLSVGYHLAKHGLRFVIVDGNRRVGDSWRNRWDSLRLFTPAKFNSLDGMRFPAPPNSFPTKDEMADYLEAYAERFRLPIACGLRVERLSRDGDDYRVEVTGGRALHARQVVVAMANYQHKRLLPFADRIDPAIRQIHSADYRNPSQLKDGSVLVIGAGNSGAEIAKELAPRHKVYVSGRHTGDLPFRVGGLLGRLALARLVLRFVFHRLLTTRTPLGRKAYPTVTSQGGPLIRVKRKDLLKMGVTWLPKIGSVENGLPVTEDGRVMDVDNIVWCTGFHPGFTWIDLPILAEDGKPRHQGGIVGDQPGLYFVGLHFLYSLSSAMIHGVGRDAERIARAVAARAGELEQPGVASASGN